MEDFWSATIGSVRLDGPKTIVDKQAGILSTKTAGIVEAKIERASNPSYIDYYKKYAADVEPDFVYVFSLFSAPLTYSTRLFTVIYPITLYPCVVGIEKSADSFVYFASSNGYKHHHVQNQNELLVWCSDEEEYKGLMREILSSQIVTQIVNSLISQSTTV